MSERFVVMPARLEDWMVVDKKTYHAVAFRKTEEEAKAIAAKLNAEVK